MTPLPPNCIQRHSKEKFVVREEKSEVRFANPKRHEVHEIRIDDCVFKEGVRCDYLVNVGEADVSCFVELKGGNVRHALEQIEHSHKSLASHRKNKIWWLVSSTRCPLASTEIQNQTLRVRKQFGARLYVKNSPLDHTF